MLNSGDDSDPFVWRLCTCFPFNEPRHWKYVRKNSHDPLKRFLFILSKCIKIAICWHRVSTNLFRHVLVDAWKLGCWLSCTKRHNPCLPSHVEQTDGTEILHHLSSRFRSHGNAVSCVSTILNTELKGKHSRIHVDLQQSLLTIISLDVGKCEVWKDRSILGCYAVLTGE